MTDKPCLVMVGHPATVPQSEHATSVRELDAPSRAPRHAGEWSVNLTPERVAIFWSRTAPGEDGCLLWSGGRTNRGYGAFNVDGRDCSAHRVAFALSKGAIPNGLVVRHACDRPACVAPSHLMLGTQRDNMRDRYDRVRPRHPMGSPVPATVITDDDVVRLRELRAAGESRAALAKRFGISQTHVGSISTGRQRVDAGGPIASRRKPAASDLTVGSALSNRDHRSSGQPPRSHLAAAWHIENGGSVAAAAGKFGISRQSVYDALRTHPPAQSAHTISRPTASLIAVSPPSPADPVAVGQEASS